MVNADHSSSCMCPAGDMHGTGAPIGFVICIPHLNARIYHAGDTNVTSEMGITEELYHPNILMLPIGDRFTMGPEGAALACSNFLKSAAYIIPMHYETFPLLSGTWEGFKAELERRNVDTKLLVHSPDHRDGPELEIDQLRLI